MTTTAPVHGSAYKTRRFLNWFPLGVAYAMLYMGRYNLTVAKNALSFITKEDFGLVFGFGTLVYGVSFLLNGPLVDKMGGRKGMLVSVAGAAAANAAIGGYVLAKIASPAEGVLPLWIVLAGLYGVNMYFQSFAAVSIVKVNAAWFHVRERGGFSGIFGTMIASGIFFAFTVNEWLLGLAEKTWPGRSTQPIVFFAPALVLFVMLVVEGFLLRDRPGEAGHADFDTGDQNLVADGVELTKWDVFGRILANPVLMTIVVVEFCTGVLRQAVMNWFPIYAKEVWALPRDHLLMGGWGLILFVAGVVGGNVAGWFSDLFFASRRAPAAFGLYAILAVCTVAMAFTLTKPTTIVDWTKEGSGLQPGDELVEVAGQSGFTGWQDVARAAKCFEPTCVASTWDPEECICTKWKKGGDAPASTASQGAIPAKVRRGGQLVDVQLRDPKPTQKAGDARALEARPVLPLSPYVLGFIVFMMSLCVIGTHGLLSGTATMDFGGRKHTATVVGAIDGAVYLGTAVQAVSLGYLTSWSWASWPIFMIPFAIVGTIALTRIWHAAPKKGGGGH
jgi:sugar phosphate permease